MDEWDFDKNSCEGIYPDLTASQSSKYAYWRCKKGHSWRARINNRYHGRGCPICSNQLVAPGINDLQTTHPQLSKEWHPTKNGALTPSQVTYGMGKKVWWICPNGHEYQASILHRAGKPGTNCPICNSGRQTSFKEQALFYYVKKLYPSAINRYKSKDLGTFELDIFIPEISVAIEYDGSAWHKEDKYDRERKKYKLCNELGIYLIRVKEEPTKKLGLDIADEMFSIKKIESEKNYTYLIHNVLKRLYFKGFYWTNPVDVDLSRDRFEIMKYATEVKNSFGEVYPDIAKEWHPTKNGTLKPTIFKPKSAFKAWWICSACGYEFEQTISHRSDGCGCPKCARQKQIETAHNNLITNRGSIKNPTLLEDWNYEKNDNFKPTQFTDGSQAKVWWKCHKCGYEWQAKISNRSHGRGCPHCAGTKLFPGENDFATIHPELLKEWDYSKNEGLDPSHIHYGSNTAVWWKCGECGYEYKTPISRRSNGSGCRKCADKFTANKRRLTFINQHGSLGDVCPDLIPEYSSDNQLSVFEITPGSSKKVKWTCSKCGHEWMAAPYTRKKGHGCPVCGIKKATSSRMKSNVQGK